MFSRAQLHFLFLSQNALSIQHQTFPVKRNIIYIMGGNKNIEHVMQMRNESINRTITTASAAVLTNLHFWLLLPLETKLHCFINNQLITPTHLKKIT